MLINCKIKRSPELVSYGTRTCVSLICTFWHAAEHVLCKRFCLQILSIKDCSSAQSGAEACLCLSRLILDCPDADLKPGGSKYPLLDRLRQCRILSLDDVWGTCTVIPAPQRDHLAQHLLTGVPYMVSACSVPVFCLLESTSGQSIGKAIAHLSMED
jgi:hypothetical protein